MRSILSVIAIFGWFGFCGKEVSQSLGTYKSFEEAAAASISKLSEDINRCPQAEVYKLSWRFPETLKGTGTTYTPLYMTVYRRDKSGGATLGYEADPGSGYSKVWKADDALVHAAATKAQGFDAFNEQKR